MRGIHSDWSVAFEAHKKFVAGVKAAVRGLCGTIPDRATISPEVVGGEPLPFAMPPMMEEAFGYRGGLRFVEFGYSARTQQFGHSDGGDCVPSDATLWIEFLSHPLVAPHLDKQRYPTLHGVLAEAKLSVNTGTRSLGGLPQGDEFLVFHCLLLDRTTRQPYICRRDQAYIFFPLTEPEVGDSHTEFVDGLLVSPRVRDQNVPATSKLAEQFLRFLDDQVDFIQGRATWPIGGRKHTAG